MQNENNQTGNKIAVYNNFMNTLSFKHFEKRDFDLLMAICAQMRDVGLTKQQIEYDYIMDLIDWDKSQSIDVFHEDLKRMNDKLIKISASVDIDEDESVTFALFSTFRRNKKRRLLTVTVNSEFKYILNELSANFTKIELKEYTSIDGRYGKQLYHQIRQRYKLKNHFWKVTADEIRHVLSIPESYETKDIYKKILKPSVDVLRGCKGLGELEVEVLRARRRGRPVCGYCFTWTEQKQIPGQMSFDDLMKEKDAKKTRKKDKFKNFEERAIDYGQLQTMLVLE